MRIVPNATIFILLLHMTLQEQQHSSRRLGDDGSDVIDIDCQRLIVGLIEEEPKAGRDKVIQTAADCTEADVRLDARNCVHATTVQQFSNPRIM